VQYQEIERFILATQKLADALYASGKNGPAGYFASVSQKVKNMQVRQDFKGIRKIAQQEARSAKLCDLGGFSAMEDKIWSEEVFPAAEAVENMLQ